LKCYNLSVPPNYWNHTPAAVVDSPDVKVLWDFNIFTDHNLTARRPDIIVIDKQTKMAQIIDVAVPADNNVSMKEKEKIDKYKDLCVEPLSLWRVHCEVSPL